MDGAPSHAAPENLLDRAEQLLRLATSSQPAAPIDTARLAAEVATLTAAVNDLTARLAPVLALVEQVKAIPKVRKALGQ